MDNFGLRFLYCFLHEKVASKFRPRESKNEFAELRRNFRTKVLDDKLGVNSQRPRRCEKLHIAV